MNGQVGRELRAAAWPEASELIAMDRTALDVAAAAHLPTVLDTLAPDVVVNAAAYTAVDRAEDEPGAAYRANRDGPAALAAACAERGTALVHLSTDYVFDGRKTGSWTPTDAVAPLGTYGASKAAGEAAVRDRLDCHIILRTAWVHSDYGHNFVKTMLRAGAERDDLRVVGDQIGGPTAASDIAAALVELAGRIVDSRDGFGTYHFCGRPPVSWHGFAEAIFDIAEPIWGRRPRLTEITSADWPTPAARPANSVLDCTALMRDHGIAQPDWRESLKPVVARLLAPSLGRAEGNARHSGNKGS
jgi:dTDP-4-dehydrorhamnose reductase